MIAVPRGVYDDLIDRALDGAPEEVCGVLGGEGGGETRVRTAEAATNAAPRPEFEYAIDPEEQLAAMERIEAGGDEVVGFYHTHPAGPPAPSATDAARASWPGRSYVIVALGGRHPFVGSWRWDGDAGRFEPEPVVIGGENAGD